MAVTVRQIPKTMAITADAVENEPDGDRWPIFERLEGELSPAQSRKVRLDAARAAYLEGQKS